MATHTTSEPDIDLGYVTSRARPCYLQNRNTVGHISTITNIQVKGWNQYGPSGERVISNKVHDWPLRSVTEKS